MLLFQAVIIARTSQNMSTKTGGLSNVNCREARMSSKRFHDIQTPRWRGALLKAVIGATDQKSCLSANDGTHQKPKSQPTKEFTIGDFSLLPPLPPPPPPPPPVLIRSWNDGGLNEALEREIFKQLQICWVVHFVTGIQ